MCTALPLDEIYQPTKFHNHSKYSFGDMLRTKIRYENKQGNNCKLRQARVKVHVHCTSPLMKSIHPQNFTTIASIVLEISTGQNSSMIKTKGNNSKIKQTRVEVHVHCTPP